MNKWMSNDDAISELRKLSKYYAHTYSGITGYNTLMKLNRNTLNRSEFLEWLNSYEGSIKQHHYKNEEEMLEIIYLVRDYIEMEADLYCDL